MKLKSILLIGISIGALITIYLTQDFDYTTVIISNDVVDVNSQFIINRTIRYILNDFSVILLLWALFENRKLIKLALFIQIIGLIVILPIYFYIKLTYLC